MCRGTASSRTSLVPQLLDFKAFTVYFKKILSRYNYLGTGLFTFTQYTILTNNFAYLQYQKFQLTALFKALIFLIYISATQSRMYECIVLMYNMNSAITVPCTEQFSCHLVNSERIIVFMFISVATSAVKTSSNVESQL